MKSSVDIKKIAKETISFELDAIKKLDSSINDVFVSVVNLIFNSKGRLIVAGIGKSANIANKLVATFNSTGQPAVFLHAADAIHGDLGNIQDGDVVMCISKSGNTSELKALLPFVKEMGNKIVALTGNTASFLAKESDFILDVSVEKEACPNNLAPTSSTTAQLVMGDAIAMSLLACKDFSDKDFARFHPGGTLGRTLLTKVSDIMRAGEDFCTVSSGTKLRDALEKMTKYRSGAVVIVEEDCHLRGILTQGDFVGSIQRNPNILDNSVSEFMTKDPVTIRDDRLAAEAIKLIGAHRIDDLVVVNEKGHAIGLVDSQDLSTMKLI